MQNIDKITNVLPPRRYLARWLWVLAIIFPTFLTGQPVKYDIKFISFDDGLPNRWVTSVAQDSTGLIWIGMVTGLATYNGREFKVVKDKEGLPFSRHITELHPVESGNFRIYTRNGTSFLLSPYEYSTDRYDFRREEFPNALQRISAPSGTTPSYFLDRENQLFGPDFHSRIDSAHLTIGGYQTTPWGTILSIDPQAWQAKEFDTTGTVIRQLNLPGQKVKRSTPKFFLSGTHPLIYNASVPDKNKPLEEILWTLGEKGKASPLHLKKDGTLMTFAHLGQYLPDRKLFLKRDLDQNIWLATRNRLWVFDQRGEMIADFSKRLDDLVGAAWTPMNFFTDAAGDLWFSTNAGIFLISPRPDLFKTYLKRERNTSIRGIINLDDNRLLVGTYQKNRIIDLATDSITSFCPISDCSCFNAFHRTENGDLLAGVYGPTPFLIRGDSIKVMGFNVLQDPLLLPYYHSSSRTYYYGTTKGLYFSKAFDDNFLPYPDVNGFDQLNSSTVTHFQETATGIWIGTSRGLFLLHPQKGIIRSELNKYNVKHFHVDDNGIFWVATATTGLVRWNPVTNEIRNYTTKNGLTNNTLYAVYEDNDHYLWLPSNKGLMRFNTANDDIISFLPEDGIAHEEFNTYSHYQTPDGTLYFGGLDGLTSFHPSSLNLKPNNSPLRINSLAQYISATDNIEDRTESLLRNGTIDMAPNDIFFLLTFDLLDYTSPNISYAWKLEGVFEEWTYQNENSLRLFGLPYGTHNLRIKGRTSGSGWIDRELVIPVIVRRPFYLSFPFLLFLPLALVVLTFGLIRYRTARLRKKSLQLQRVVAERTEELASKNDELQATNKTKDRLFTMISHDLRSPLISLRSLVKKVNYLLERGRIDEVRLMSSTVDEAVNRTQSLLDNLLSWAIVQGEGFKYRPEQLSVEKLLQETYSIYLDSAEAKSINLRVDLTDGPDSLYADERSMLTILRNLVDNAIKFTPSGGRVILSSSAGESNLVKIQVTDNGTGMPEQQLSQLFSLDRYGATTGTAGEKGTGLGLVLCADLARQNNGHLTVQSDPGKGTTLSLLMPAYKR